MESRVLILLFNLTEESERVRKLHSPQRLHAADAGPQEPRTAEGAGRLPEPSASRGPPVVAQSHRGSGRLPEPRASRGPRWQRPQVWGGHPQVLNQGQSPDGKGSSPAGWGALPGTTLRPEEPLEEPPGVLRRSSLGLSKLS